MRPSHLLLVLILSLKTVSVAFAQNGDGSKASTRPLAGQKNALALVIGNGDYANAGPLVKTLADADSMAAALGSLGFEVIKRKNADLKEMKQVLAEFAARLQGGSIPIALVYFSGHGIQANGENYLVPTDAAPLNEADIEFTCLPANRVLVQMDWPGVRTRLIFLDACRTNPFARSWGRSGGSKGLAMMDAPEGTFIAYGSSPNKESFESSQKPNGIFTYALLSHIRTPGLTIDELFNRVTAGTQDQATRESRKQLPWRASSLRDNFYFRPAARPQPNPVPTDPVQPPTASDYDGDGVADAADDCPTEPGKAAYRGCPLPPDGDGDGVADPDDLCPQQPGASGTKGCPDSDGDGLPDHLDKCPNEAGAAADKGCPKVQPTDPMGCIFIRGGTFQMGSTDGESDEKPVHTVTLTDFWLGKTEVTVGEYKAFVDATGYVTDAEKEDGSYIWDGSGWNKRKGINWRHDEEGHLRPLGQHGYPVVHVSWNDATAFAEWASKKHGKNYRLPTEAEWEYAAGNGAKHTKYSWGNGEPSGKRGGNVADETAQQKFPDWTIFKGYTDGYVYAAPVASFEANELGLYDMSGNVWEWCSDWYGSDYYEQFRSSSAQNPKGPSSGDYRVLRGGSWNLHGALCRSANRLRLNPSDRNLNLGFRLARH